MKVTIDATRCQAYGNCHEHAPQLFQLDEWGYAYVVVEGDVPAELEAVAREAVGVCPAGAIGVVE
jgi:ferredoxin